MTANMSYFNLKTVYFLKNTEGVHGNIKNQKPFEQHTQKAFLRKNTEGPPLFSESQKHLLIHKTNF
jgi:hypothetical protein